jgi:hypothetical protein
MFMIKKKLFSKVIIIIRKEPKMKVKFLLYINIFFFSREMDGRKFSRNFWAFKYIKL